MYQCRSTRRWYHVRTWEPCRQAEQHSSSHVELLFYKFLRDTSYRGITVIQVTDYKTWQRVFVASVVRNWRTDPILRISKYAVWQILSACCFMVSPLTNMTPRLRAELQKDMPFLSIFRTSGGSEDWDGSKCSASFCSSFSWNLLWMVHFFTSLTQFWVLQNRDSVLERWVELHISVSLSNIRFRTELRSVVSDRVCVYRMKRIGLNTKPWGRP